MKSAFLQRLKRVLDMIRNWRDLEMLYDDLKYSKPHSLPDFDVDDYVKKVTGDYHIHGYVLAIFRTKYTKQVRIAVEHRAEGGGSFLHIYSPANLELVRKPLLPVDKSGSSMSEDQRRDLQKLLGASAFDKHHGDIYRRAAARVKNFSGSDNTGA